MEESWIAPSSTATSSIDRRLPRGERSRANEVERNDGPGDLEVPRVPKKVWVTGLQVGVSSMGGQRSE